MLAFVLKSNASDIVGDTVHRWQYNPSFSVQMTDQEVVGPVAAVLLGV